MKFSVSVYGLGAEYCLGSVEEEIWNYVQEHFNGSAEDYWNALEGGEVPDEFKLCDMIEDCDDICHYAGCFLSCATIEVKDENGNTIFSLNSGSIDTSEVQEIHHKLKIGYSNRYDYISVVKKVEKSSWSTDTFEIDGEFDPSKLFVEYTSFSMDDGPIDDGIVTGILYAYNYLSLGFEGSVGKGCEFEFINRSDIIRAREAAKEEEEKKRAAEEEKKCTTHASGRDKGVYIWELVEKYLKEAAPNPMSANKIFDKLKEEGLPDTKSFATRVYGLLSKWAKEGKIVRVTPGTYKLPTAE